MPSHRRPRIHFPSLDELPSGVLPAVAVVLVIAIGVVGLAISAQLAHNAANAHTAPPLNPPSLTLPPALAQTWTAIENAKPGTSDWTLDAGGGHPSAHGEIEGFASAVSAQRGETVTIYVSTTAASWTVSAFRSGWYQGKLARLVWTSTDQPGVRQPGALRHTPTNMVEAVNWAPSLTVNISPDWLPGDYLLKLRSSANGASYIPLTVRDDDSHSPILINNSVTTWQAYNHWGGYSLYAGPTGSNDRANVVSFDRPYALDNGAGDFLGNEEKFVKLAERQGLDVSYTTDVDIAAHPERILQHRVLVSLGHDEYWSTAMRQGVETARDHGVNLLFLGANAVYRHIRFEPSVNGSNRHEINYRSAVTDPLAGVDNAEVTVQWRDPPVNDPENTLLGEMYECNPVTADLIVSNPDAWIYAGTGLTKNEHLRGLVGSEYDHWSPGPKAVAVDLISRSPVVCRGHPSTSDFTYYVAPSGAGVIDTGTNLWVPMILDDPRIGTTVADITMTMLRESQTGPLGRIHPQAAAAPVEGTSVPPPPPGE